MLFRSYWLLGSLEYRVYNWAVDSVVANVAGRSIVSSGQGLLRSEFNLENLQLPPNLDHFRRPAQGRDSLADRASHGGGGEFYEAARPCGGWEDRGVRFETIRGYLP